LIERRDVAMTLAFIPRIKPRSGYKAFLSDESRAIE
jgi:hypothetical protein